MGANDPIARSDNPDFYAQMGPLSTLLTRGGGGSVPVAAA